MRNKTAVIGIATVLGVGLGALLGYGPLQKFKSEGVLSMEFGTSEYKRFTELANDGPSFKQYITALPPANIDENNLQQILKTVPNGEWHKALPKISKADAKELPDIVVMMERDRQKEKEKEKDSDKDQSEQNTRKDGIAYLGVRIAYVAQDPLQAQKIAAWLGLYFKEIATREAVRELVSNWSAENRQFSDRALEQQLKYKFDIEQAEARAGALKKLIANYPSSVGSESRQVVDIRKENEKFISPMAQLVGAESQIIEIKEKTQKLSRKIEQQAFIAPLISQAHAELLKTRSGSESVSVLTQILDEARKKVKTDAEREKLLTLAADLSQISARFLSQAQFIAEPYLPTRSERPTPSVFMAFFGLLFALLAAGYSWRKELIAMLRQAMAIDKSHQQIAK